VIWPLISCKYILTNDKFLVQWFYAPVNCQLFRIFFCLNFSTTDEFVMLQEMVKTFLINFFFLFFSRFSKQKHKSESVEKKPFWSWKEKKIRIKKGQSSRKWSLLFTLQLAGNVDFNYQGNMEELVQDVHKARSKLIFSPWVLKWDYNLLLFKKMTGT
jgi:hypothetical protein